MTTITVTFDPPLPSDSPATFNSKAFNTLGALNTWSTQANAQAVEVSASAAAAAASAGTASTHASTATTQAGIATTQAGIATTQAGLATTNGAAQVALAAAQVSLATTQANTATTQAGTATTQAGIATTKASEADASAIAAAASAASIAPGSLLTAANPSYTGTLTGGTGVVNLGSGQFVKDASGNLGLGVTPSAWSSGKAIEVGAQGNAVWSQGANDMRITSNINFYGGYKYASTNPVSMLVMGDSSFYWYTAPSGTAGNPISFTQAMTLDASGNLTLSAGAMGYGTGAGGTVTQATSKSTAVTLNKPSGTVTMHNASLAAGASVAFTLNNTFFGSYDAVVLAGKSWSTRYRIENANSATGLIGIRVTNTEAFSCSDPLEISFAIVKGAAA